MTLSLSVEVDSEVRSAPFEKGAEVVVGWKVRVEEGLVRAYLKYVSSDSAGLVLGTVPLSSRIQLFIVLTNNSSEFMHAFTSDNSDTLDAPLESTSIYAAYMLSPTFSGVEISGCLPT